jgi:D-inositol-3-phosphate glycosyltransferase
MRVAMVSMHGCPLARLGEKDAGGMNVYVRELSKALGGLGASVDVFTRCQDYSSTQVVELSPCARVVHIEAGAVQYIDKRDLYPIVPEFTRNVLGFVSESGLAYDVVHTHYWLSGLAGLTLIQAWNTPLVSMFHTLAALKNTVARSGEEREPDLRLQSEHAVIAAADRIIAANRLEKADLERHYRAPDERIVVIPCGVDLRLFQQTDKAGARALLGLPQDRHVLLFVGRLEPIKGVDILLQALANVVARGERPLTLVAGGNLEGDEGQRLVALASSLGLSDDVRFIGAVDQKMLPAFYSAADVCVQPSFYESFGMVAIEAMACGLPVVASRAGGLPFSIRDGETGLLVVPGDPSALAGAISALLANPDLRLRMGEAGHQRAHRYRWRHVANEVSAVYEELLAERSATCRP